MNYLGLADSDSLKAALLDFVPIEELVDVVGFRIEVRFDGVSQRKTELADRVTGFTGGDGNSDVEFSLGHGKDSLHTWEVESERVWVALGGLMKNCGGWGLPEI
jgi:hypothetical protein